MVDAMDLSKAEIIVLFGDFINDCAEMLGVKNDSEQICLAIETLNVERDDAIRCAEKAEIALAKARAMLCRFQWAGTTELSDGGDEACCPCCEWPERQRQHAPGCDLAAEIGAVVVSHETPIGERQADDGMGGGHGG